MVSIADGSSEAQEERYAAEASRDPRGEGEGWWQCSLASLWAVQPDEHGAATWHAYVQVYVYYTEHGVYTSTHQLKVG